MKHITLLLFILLSFQSCKDYGKEISMSGTTMNLDGEAIVITGGGVYWIDGLSDWGDLADKRVAVKGYLDSIDIDVYKAIKLDGKRIQTYFEGKQHKIKVIRKPEWKLDSIQSGDKITVSGIARDDLKYANYIDANDETVFMDGSFFWDDSVVNRKVIVTGDFDPLIIDAYSETIIEQNIGTSEMLEFRAMKNIEWKFDNK